MGRNRRKSVQAVVIVIAHLLFSQTAFADPKLEQAQKHYLQAQAYFKAGTFDKAIVEYTAAYDLAPRPVVLFNIGLCHESAGAMEKAVALYDRYLAIAEGDTKMQEAKARREALVRAIERRDADVQKMKDAAAQRAAGNRALGASDWDAAIVALKASYALSADTEVLYELAEAYRQKGETAVAKIEYERYLSLANTGSHREDAAKRIREIETAEQAQLITSKPVMRPMKRGPRGSLVPSIVAFSMAGGAGLAGVFFGLKSAKIRDEVDGELDGGIPPFDTGDPRLDDGKSAALAANISYSIAGVATAVGGYLLYRAFQRDMVPIESGDAVLVPTAGLREAGLAVEVTF